MLPQILEIPNWYHHLGRSFEKRKKQQHYLFNKNLFPFTDIHYFSSLLVTNFKVLKCFTKSIELENTTNNT